MMLLLLSLGIVISINLVLFLIAYKQQSDRLTDFSYALSFIVVVLAALFLSPSRPPLLTIAVLMAVVWALRLGVFLVIRIRKKGKDSRFDSIRHDFIQFGKFWLGQGIVAWILLLPVLFMADNATNVGWFAYAGMAIWLGGLMIETVADLQKYRFSQDVNNKGKWITSGLWSRSRHPNYFGEICIWIGMYVMVFSSLDTIEKIVGLASPVMIYITLRYISGVPPLEKYADDTWGNDSKYQQYKTKTNLLIPSLFPKS